MFGLPIGLIIKVGIALALAALVYAMWYQVNNWCNAACIDQKNLYKASQDAYAEAVLAAAAKIGVLEAGNAALSKKYENALREKDAQAAIAAKAIKARILASEELKRLNLSADAIRLFDESANQGRTDSEGASDAKPGDATAGSAPVSVTGTELFEAININNAAHWDCVRKVEQWIGFWKDYTANVQSVSE